MENWRGLASMMDSSGHRRKPDSRRWACSNFWMEPQSRRVSKQELNEFVMEGAKITSVAYGKADGMLGNGMQRRHVACG